MNTERSHVCWPNDPTSIPSLMRPPGQFTLIWESGNMADARLQECTAQKSQPLAPVPSTFLQGYIVGSLQPRPALLSAENTTTEDLCSYF